MSVRAVMVALSGATWDISTAAYSGKSLSVNAQVSNPNSTAFSTDGTKVYTVGGGTAVCQYTLATPWDLSTGSYSGKSLAVVGLVTFPIGLAFSSDGLKLYVLGQGSSTSTVYQYTLSAPWDISTGVYASKTLSITAQDTTAYSVYFSQDGVHMYVAGHANTTIYQYTLSTPWDISTGSYAAKSLNVSAQTGVGTLTGVSMSADGTKVYAVKATAATIYQYTLATAFDISTGAYSGKTYNTSAQVSSPYGLAFSLDGLKMYIANIGNGTLYQYSLL